MLKGSGFSRIFEFSVFLILATYVLSPQAHAVSFGIDNFLDPEVYIHASEANRAHLRDPFEAVVLIGGLASGVIISADGLMVTARHTITDFYVDVTNDCHKIPLFIYHEVAADGSVDRRLTKIQCDKILVSEYGNDFVLMKVSSPEGYALPHADIETDEKAIQVGMTGIAVGHPNASNFEKAVKKVTDGPIVLYEPHNEELPHFLHLIDTEGGSSGCPIFSENGKVIGIHFRGIPELGHGVEVTIDGAKQTIRRFNVALPLPYLYAKYREFFGK